MKLLFKWKYFPQALLVLLTASVYSFSASFPLLEGWDDHAYVSCNTERLHPSLDNMIYWLGHPCEGCYLPLTMYSYMLDYAVCGLNSVGYHIQSIFWHTMAVLAVFNIMKWFGINLWLAFALSLIFSIHPQRVESVVWISERKDVMCAAFYFWSFYYYISGDRQRFPLIPLILFILAMLSKSMAISLPLVFIVCEYAAENKFNPKAWTRKLWPFFLVAAVFLPVTIMSQDINREGISLSRQAYVLVHNVAWYVRTAFVSGWPSPIYPRVTLSSSEIFTTVSCYIVLIAAAMYFFLINKMYFRDGVIPLFCCFLASLAPVAGFFPLGAIDYADRYSYIPSAFLWTMVGGLIINTFRKISSTERKQRSIINLKLMTYGGILYIMVFAFMNVVYSDIWRDYCSVLTAACVHEPPSYIALGALGDVELSRGNYGEAIKISERIISRQKGLETEKGYAKIILKAKYTMAYALYKNGDKQQALKIFEEIKPYLNENSFGALEGYVAMVKMMVDSCNSIGDSERAEKLKKEIICR